MGPRHPLACKENEQQAEAQSATDAPPAMTDDSPVANLADVSQVVNPVLIVKCFGEDDGKDENVDDSTELIETSPVINTADISPVVDPELMAARVGMASVFTSTPNIPTIDSPGNTQPDSSKIDNNTSTNTKDSNTKPDNSDDTKKKANNICRVPRAADTCDMEKRTNDGRDETVDDCTESIETSTVINMVDVSPVIDPESMAKYFGQHDDETAVPTRVGTAAAFTSTPNIPAADCDTEKPKAKCKSKGDGKNKAASKKSTSITKTTSDTSKQKAPGKKNIVSNPTITRKRAKTDVEPTLESKTTLDASKKKNLEERTTLPIRLSQEKGQKLL
jgi:hypothetical protein